MVIFHSYVSLPEGTIVTIDAHVVIYLYCTDNLCTIQSYPYYMFHFISMIHYGVYAKHFATIYMSNIVQVHHLLIGGMYVYI